MLLQNCQEERRGPLSAERGILTALSCSGGVPDVSCPPARHLLLRLQVHLSLCVLSWLLPLTPSSSQHLRSASWSCWLVKLQMNREDREDNFSHAGVWQCQCLSFSMSLVFITTSLFPGRPSLVPSARCRDQLFSLRGLCSDPLAAFHSGGSFLILPPS